MNTNRKRLIFWMFIVLINLFSIEIILSVVFFQRYSELPFAIVHYWNAGARRILKLHNNFFNKDSGRIIERDPKFGYSHIANSSRTHKKLDFQVTYTIGDDKERYIPMPDKPLGRILFLGGSETFGHGIDDDKNYPYLLSKEHWKNWHIINKAVMGWGTSHAYLLLSEELESDNPPSMVIYSMIPHHITRNYVRKSWVRNIAKYGRDHPHFELVNGNLVFQGVVNEANSIEDSPEIREKELDLTTAFLIGIQKKC